MPLVQKEDAARARQPSRAGVESSVVMGDPSVSSETCRAAAVLRVAHDAICAAVHLRRLRRVVPDVGREPGFGATRS